MRKIAFTVLMVGFAACDPGEGPSRAGQSDAAGDSRGRVVDSAGVRVVTTAPNEAVYARVADEPALLIGDVDGSDAFLFERILSVKRSAEGDVVVAENGSQEVRVFDAGGAHLRTMGGKGEGPDEFQSLSGAWPVDGGGTLAVQNWPQPHMVRFDAEGSIAGAARLEGFSSPWTFLTSLGIVGSESLLGSVSELVVEEHEEPFRPPVSFVLYGLDGVLVDTIATLPGQAGSVLVSLNRTGATRMGLPSLPMTAGPTAAGSADGIAITGGDVYEVRFFDPSGSPTQIARLAEAPPVRTDAHVETYVRETHKDLRERFGDELDEWYPSEEEDLARHRDLPLLPDLPAYVQLRFADTGELWARRYSLPGAATRRWDVFSRDGHHLGRVVVPASLLVTGVSHGQLFGVSVDDLDVERVEFRDLELLAGNK